MEYRKIENPEQISRICDSILRALPGWFGIEESIVEYVAAVREMAFWAAFDGEAPVGFAALKAHNPHTSEVAVMGILAEYHRRGIGRALMERCAADCRARGNTFLTVKTLDAARPSRSYEKTRQFYLAMGFVPLEVFPLLWDADNPCLFMARYLG